MVKELTKDAEYLLYASYKFYLEEVEKGVLKSNAKKIGHIQKIKDDIMPEWSLDTINESCKTLSNEGYFTSTFSSDIAYDNSLADKAIIFMENKFKNNTKELLKTLKDIKSLILF